MKFSIEYTGIAEQRLLTYNNEECSFDIEPIDHEINFDIVVNKLNLTVIEDNKIIQVWGFCGLNKSIKLDFEVPKSKKGVLKVLDNLESGFAYGISKEDLPIYVNIQTGWVCIGNPEKSGNAVEFIKNCVAVIDTNKEFISLWLKPQSLPEI